MFFSAKPWSYILLALLQLLGTSYIGADDEVVFEDPQPKLVGLGVVDGKAYFVDQTRRTWNETDAYCNSFGMQLGSITSEAELSFLQSSHNATTFHSGFWLSARDSFEERQFSWDSSGNEVTTLGSLRWVVAGEPARSPLTCLAYVSEAGNTSYIAVWQCTLNGMQALCELK